MLGQLLHGGEVLGAGEAGEALDLATVHQPGKKRKAHILIFIAQQSKHLKGLLAPPVSDEKFVCVAKNDHIQGQLGPPASDEKCVCVCHEK